MRKVCGTGLVLLLIAAFTIQVCAQKNSPTPVIHTIPRVPTPQGVAYSLETNKLFVGSDEGKLYVFDGTTFDLITSIDFGDDVDNLRYDAEPGLRLVDFEMEHIRDLKIQTIDQD